MGETDGNDDEDEDENEDDSVAARRQFVRRLRAHEAVRTVDFSRDGFRTVVVALEPDADFRDRWHRTATRLGYTVERVTADEFAADLPGDVWTLELTDTEKSAERSTWRTTVRGAVDRIRTALDRLLGRSNR